MFKHCCPCASLDWNPVSDHSRGSHSLPLVVVAVSSAVGGRVVLKIGVVARRLGRDAACGIVHKHHLQKFETGLVQRADERVAVVSLPLRE